MNYVQICTDFIVETGFITHKRIYELTGTNCSYSVMRQLRLKFDFQEIQCKSSLGHSYILYKMIKDKRKELNKT